MTMGLCVDLAWIELECHTETSNAIRIPVQGIIGACDVGENEK